MSFQTFWKSRPIAVRAAIITGVFGLLSIFFVALLGILKDNKGPSIGLKINDIRIAYQDSTSYIDLVFWNTSEVSISLTSLTFTLKQAQKERNSSLSTSKYDLEGAITTINPHSGYFQGQVHSELDSLISYPFSGTWMSQDNQQWWMLRYSIAIREKFSEGENRSILIEIPRKISLFEKDKSQKINFMGFLETQDSPIEITVTAHYANGKKVGTKKHLSFSQTKNIN